MRTVFRFAFVCALVAPVASFAQSSNSNAADQAWARLTALHKQLTAPPGAIKHSSAAPASGNTTSPAVATTTPTVTAEYRQKVEREVQARNTRRAVTVAKDFYTRYPSHPQAATAKKLEALDAIAGLVDGDTVYEQFALKIAGDYRSDKANPVSDRFDVAHAMERHVVEQKLHGTSWIGHAIEGEMMVDRLHAEFGEIPEVYGTYLALAEHTDCDSSRILARRILQMPAPAGVKASAQRLLDRAALLRQPLDFPLTDDKGKATTLAKLAGKTTVVVFWDGTHDPGGPPGFDDFKKNPLSNTSWVYVSLGTIGALPKGASARSLPPGTTCVEPLGLKSALVDRLKFNRLPWVLVLDDKQKLTGHGGPSQLAWLLANPDRPFEP